MSLPLHHTQHAQTGGSWFRRVRAFLARTPTVGELLLVVAAGVFLLQLLLRPSEPKIPFYALPTRTAVAGPVSFPPWLQHCHETYHTREVERLKAKDLTIRQWKLAQSSFTDTKHSQRVKFEKELVTALGNAQEDTFINAAYGETNPTAVKRANYVDAMALWLGKELDRLEWKARPAPVDCTTHAIVMLEGRISPRVIFVIRHTFYMLRTDPQPWALIIFHSREATKHLVEGLEIWPGGAGEHVQLRLIDQDRIDRNVANQIVMSPDWWSLIPVENILLLQSDVIMMKPPAAEPDLWHELTHKYIYVGGLLPQPGWKPEKLRQYDGFGSYPHTMFTGNGGCSMRQKTPHLELLRALTCSPMIPKLPEGQTAGTPGGDPKLGQCTFSSRFLYTAGPDETLDEDRWIGWQISKQQEQFRGRLALQPESQKWAVDSMFYADPFFTHKYWQTWQDWQFPTQEEGMRWLSRLKFYYTEV